MSDFSRPSTLDPRGKKIELREDQVQKHDMIDEVKVSHGRKRES